MKKLKCTKGETIVEALVSLIISVLVLGFFATAILTAAQINNNVKNADVSLKYDGVRQNGTVNIQSQSDLNVNYTVDVNTYVTDNGYIYYSGK